MTTSTQQGNGPWRNLRRSFARLAGRPVGPVATAAPEPIPISEELQGLIRALDEAIGSDDARAIIIASTVLLARVDLSEDRRRWALRRRMLARINHTHYLGAIDDASRIMDMAPTDRAVGERGVALYHLERYAEAIEDFSRSIALAETTDMLTWRGAARFYLNDIKAARADLTRATTLSPGDLTAMKWRAYIAGHVDDDDLEVALRELELAIAAMPDVAVYRYHRAEILAKLDRHVEAIRELDAVVTMAPPQVEGALALRAKYKRHTGDRAGAIEDYGAALALDPEYEAVRDARLWLLHEDGQIDQAIADANDYVAVLGTREAYTERIKLWRELGQADKVEADLKLALEVYPDNQTFKAQYAESLVARDDHDGALAILETLSSRFLSGQPALLRAELFERMGRLDEALAAWDNILWLSPAFVVGLRARARVKTQLGRTDEANADLAAADEAEAEQKSIS